MDQENIVDSEVVFTPKRCIILTDMSEIGVNITSPDTEGNETRIYSDDNDGEQMPIISSYSQSQVWIDPSSSPYVLISSQKHQAIREAGGCITVEQHNTCNTQNVCEIMNAPETSNQQESNTNYYEDEVECGVFQSQLAEEIIIEEQSNVATENNALNQLLDNSMKGPKPKKTILFLGNDSCSGQTIQNISYNNPMLKCAGSEVNNEVVIQDSSSPLPEKKKYECDKCKQLFKDILDFRQHIIGNHSKYNTTSNYMCTKCGTKLKDQKKFEIHCLGHGNPDLECPECHKVYSSKFNLQTHQKIHKRNFHCTVCVRSYSTLEDLNNHLSKAHTIYECKYVGCNYKTSKRSELRPHHESHASKELSMTENGERGQETDMIVTDEADLKSEGSEVAEENDAKDRIRKVDTVIAKVMSNMSILLNDKNTKTHAKNKVCNVCYKSFDRIGGLKRHLIEHIVKSTLAKTPVNESGGRAMVCEICQTETFTALDKYRAHLREHAKLTMYICSFCDKSFSDSSNFSKHKKIHGLSYFQCDLCQKKFNTKKMIAQHMENHNKVSPVKCQYCPRTFHFQSTLNRHIRGVHYNDTIVRFRCRFCDDRFKASKDKLEHEWTIHHVRKTIIDCSTCGAKFRKKSELKKHRLDIHEVNL